MIVNNAFTYKTTEYSRTILLSLRKNCWRKYRLNINNNSRYVYCDLLFREFVILTIW